MSVLIKVPVVSTGITLNEIPDKVSYFFEIGECQKDCEGCHSPHLHKEVLCKLNLEDMEMLAEQAIDNGANAILLMGGTTNGIDREALITIINNLAGIAPVGLYSGSDDTKTDLKLALDSNLTWLKTGSYKAELGGLTSPTTNQKFYRKDYFMSSVNFSEVKCTADMIDMTDYFRKKANETFE